MHADPQHRERVIETYTFNIEYIPHAEQGDQVLVGLEMDTPGSSLVSVEATNGAMQLLLRQIMNVCEALPKLPGEHLFPNMFVELSVRD